MDDMKWNSVVNFKAFLTKECARTITQLWLREQTVFLVWMPPGFSKLCWFSYVCSAVLCFGFFFFSIEVLRKYHFYICNSATFGKFFFCKEMLNETLYLVKQFKMYNVNINNLPQPTTLFCPERSEVTDVTNKTCMPFNSIFYAYANCPSPGIGIKLLLLFFNKKHALWILPRSLEVLSFFYHQGNCC